MKAKSLIFILGFTLILWGCENNASMESLHRQSEKMEAKILKSVDAIALYRANYERILREAPGSDLAPLACYKLGKLNEIFGHYQDAGDYYQKLLVQYPEHPIGAEGLFNLAQIYQVHLNKPDDAVTAYTQLVHFYPEEKVAFQGLIQLGQLLSKQEKWNDAIFYFQTIVEKYPDQNIGADLYFRMGDIFQNKLNEPNRAFAMYRMVVEKYPNSTWVKLAQQRLTLTGNSK